MEEWRMCVAWRCDMSGSDINLLFYKLKVKIWIDNKEILVILLLTSSRWDKRQIQCLSRMHVVIKCMGCFRLHTVMITSICEDCICHNACQHSMLPLLQQFIQRLEILMTFMKPSSLLFAEITRMIGTFSHVMWYNRHDTKITSFLFPHLYHYCASKYFLDRVSSFLLLSSWHSLQLAIHHKTKVGWKHDYHTG